MLMLLAAVLVTGCSENDEQPVAGDAITLDAQVIQPVTRAGGTACIDYSVLARTGYGFGVYAYGLTAGDWHNKQVTYNGSESDPVQDLGSVHLHSGNWTYGTPVDWKDQTVSFLAYAPYVAAGSGSTGITAVSGSDVDNTLVTYAIATSPDQCVDLLWGVRETTKLPWLNTRKGTAGGNVTFTFHHALSAIGFHVQAMIDKENDLDDFGDVSDVDALLGTVYKVTIKQMTLSGNFFPSAQLNLNNTSAGVPRWVTGAPASAANTLTVGNTLVNAAFRHPDVVTPTTSTTAEAIMTGGMTGMTQAAEQRVIIPHATTNAEQCFFVIPNNEVQNYTLTIDWCVSRHSNGTYTAEDHTSVLNIPSTELPLAPETKYYINLVFNLKTVRFNITATDWTDTPVPVGVTIEHGTSASESLAPKRK